MESELQIFTDAASMRAFSRQQRKLGKTVGMVPTMGNLHEGHIALVTAARKEADIVVASIYVNPTQVQELFHYNFQQICCARKRSPLGNAAPPSIGQWNDGLRLQQLGVRLGAHIFAKNEDFDQYPRQRQADRRMLQAAGCDAVFEPASLYFSPSRKGESSAVVGMSGHTPGEHETFIQVEQLQQGLCGRSRPTFFRGVATVVAKLFNIVEPDAALFGRKDFQQWRLLERMARDLDFGIRILGLPIVRHEDGLAMSSRNSLLSEEDRGRAPCIHQALQGAAQSAASGDAASPQQLCGEVERRIADGGGRVDYVEVVDAEELAPVDSMAGKAVVIAVAAFFGSVRLIDNIVIEPSGHAAADGSQ